MQKLIELWKKAFGVPEEERIKLGKEIWRIAVEEQWAIGTVGLSPRRKVRIVSNNMGNVPARMVQQSGWHDPGHVSAGDVLFKK